MTNTLSTEARAVYTWLVDNIENEPDGGWSNVNLTRHHHELGFNDHQFAGYLSALAVAGLYEPYSGIDAGLWGDVKLPDGRD